jgi:hypothetical protein
LTAKFTAPEKREKALIEYVAYWFLLFAETDAAVRPNVQTELPCLAPPRSILIRHISPPVLKKSGRIR